MLSALLTLVLLAAVETTGNSPYVNVDLVLQFVLINLPLSLPYLRPPPPSSLFPSAFSFLLSSSVGSVSVLQSTGPHFSGRSHEGH